VRLRFRARKGPIWLSRLPCLHVEFWINASRSVGITAAVATLVGYTSGLFYGFSLRVLYSGYLLGTTVLIILSIYMGPVARQVDYHQAIQSILYCAYITTIVIFITENRAPFSQEMDSGYSLPLHSRLEDTGPVLCQTAQATCHMGT
jgi:hypothetical protein